ncbi:B12-binding domain-containing radical SAM protein [Thermodesulfobacteriota bacterium]
MVPELNQLPKVNNYSVREKIIGVWRYGVNTLFIFPLNEPYNTIISASKTAWKSKLNVYKNIKKLDCAYPTGLLSISAYLKKHNPDINIKILDLNAVMNQVAQRKNETSEDFENYKFEDLITEALSLVDGFIPHIIGISTLFCSNYKDLKPLTSFLRKIYPEGLIVCGGHLASSIYDRIYEDDIEIDAVVFGEGEIPFLELVGAFLSGREVEYLSLSPCWITKEKSKPEMGFTPEIKALDDLDEIPPFDLSMLVFPEVYYNSTRYFFVIESQEDQREMFIFSTRGCPFSCIFCASQVVHGHKVRSHSVDRIKSDILYYNEKYNITRFIFYDDHFLFNKARAIEMLNFISQNNFIAEIPTPAFFSIDEDVASAMKSAGIKEVNITIETGNENTFKNIMHKPGSLKKANEAVDFLHKEGIIAVSNILIGLPGETRESIEKGLEYLLTTNIDWFQCFVAAPLPGSKLYKICEENEYFVPNYDISLMDYKKCLIRTEDFTPEYIEKKVYEMNLKLNFTNNYHIRTGNYDIALKLFERIINSVIDTHAFAYYFAAKCCSKLHLDEKYQVYKSKYKEMVTIYPFWREYAIQFNLEDLD